MTTTVTLKTHSWPVDVTTTTTNDFDRSLYTRTETVNPNETREFHISSNIIIQFTELPIENSN